MEPERESERDLLGPEMTLSSSGKPGKPRRTRSSLPYIYINIYIYIYIYSKVLPGCLGSLGSGESLATVFGLESP